MPGYFINALVPKRPGRGKVIGKTQGLKTTTTRIPVAKGKKIRRNEAKQEVNSESNSSVAGKVRSREKSSASVCTNKSTVALKATPMDVQVLADDSNEKEDQLASLLSTDVLGSHQVITTLLFTGEASLFNDRTALLKTLAMTLLATEQSKRQLHFSFLVVCADRVYDLLDGSRAVDQKAESAYSRRAIFSAEHVFDLLQLGKLNGNLNTAWLADEAFHVCHFAWGDADAKQDCHLKHFFLVEGSAGGTTTISEGSLKTVQQIEAAVRTRQRKEESSIAAETAGSALLTILKPTFTSEQSKMVVLYKSPPKSNLNAKMDHLANCFQRMKVYGTEEDDYGENLIQMNEELLQNLQQPEKTKVYLYLLNNVSTLEADLLEAHKHFNEIMHNWLANHQHLQVMSTASHVYDVEQYTNQLVTLLSEQQLQIGHLIDSVRRFQTGLAQLRQSVQLVDE